MAILASLLGLQFSSISATAAANPSKPIHKGAPAPAPSVGDASPASPALAEIARAWRPGTLIPHIYDSHHHGAMGEWIPDLAQIASMRVDVNSRWSALFANRAIGTEDVILIPAGVTVIYDHISTQPFKALVVLGALEFAPDITSKLTVGTIFVGKTGALRIKPNHAGIKSIINFSGRLNVTEDPVQFCVGLFTSGGNIEVEGSGGKTPFTTTSSARAGAAVITVNNASGWAKNDILVFPDLQPGSDPGYWNYPGVYAGQTEKVLISAVNGNEITLSTPLRFDHLEGGPAHVGNASRNIIFSSDLAGGGARSHVLFGGHARVRFNNVTLVDMGRTTTAFRDDTVMDMNGMPVHVGQNQRARYALHAHHVHEPVTFHNNAILGIASPFGSDRFGIVIHDSRADLRNNVIVGARGSGIFLEDGVESGAAENNLVIGMGGGTGHGDELRFADSLGEDMAAGGFGIWARGSLVLIKNNVATGYFSQSAYAFFTHNNFVSGLVPDIPGTPSELVNQTLKLSQVPFQWYGGFEGNLAHGIFRNALEITYQQVAGGTLIKDFTAILLGKSSKGVFINHAFRVVLQNPVILGAGGGIGLINNSGAETSVDISGGLFSNLGAAIVTTPRGGKIVNTSFSGTTYNIAVQGGSGQVEVSNYAGSGKNYRLFQLASETTLPTITLPGLLGVALPLN